LAAAGSIFKGVKASSFAFVVAPDAEVAGKCPWAADAFATIGYLLNLVRIWRQAMRFN
jgi:hypothetical protein